jgi:hypothetical protein
MPIDRLSVTRLVWPNSSAATARDGSAPHGAPRVRSSAARKVSQMHGPTPSEQLRRALWTAIAEDDWAQADLDAAVSAYVRDARERELPLAEIRRSLRVHVQQVGLGLTAERYEIVARHVIALAETAHRGVFSARHTSQTLSLPVSEDEG